MQISGDLYKLDRSCGIAELLKNIARLFGCKAQMRKAVFREPEGGKGFIRTDDIGPDRLIFFYFFI